VTPVRRLRDLAELREVSKHDPFVAAETDPAHIGSVWAGADGALGWVVPSRRVPGRTHVTTLGPAAATVELLLRVGEELGSPPGSVTLPRDADEHLPAGWSLRPRNDWEWFVTREAPPRQPREEEVGWLTPDHHEEVASLLERWSPRHDADPGKPGVLRWCGIRDEHGRLVATAAHTEHVPGVPHLASIATHGETRGRGYGAAVTAWLTRRLLAEGTGRVTLAMYSDNAVARRVYHRLGYRCDHFFTSGGLIRRPARSSAVATTR
jgi:ribosomal protein S18 acetylase RimI-like enzyme